jgi:hypothetical protein
MAVLLAVRGGGPYYRLQPGKNTVDERSGKNTWEDMPCESSACRSRARMQAELAHGRGRGHFQVTADAHRARHTHSFRCKESFSAPLLRRVRRAAFAQLALAYLRLTHTHTQTRTGVDGRKELQRRCARDRPASHAPAARDTAALPAAGTAALATAGMPAAPKDSIAATGAATRIAHSAHAHS